MRCAQKKENIIEKRLQILNDVLYFKRRQAIRHLRSYLKVRLNTQILRKRCYYESDKC